MHLILFIAFGLDNGEYLEFMKIAAIMTFYSQLFQEAALENNVSPPLQCCHYQSYQVSTTSPLPFDSQNPDVLWCPQLTGPGHTLH